MSKNLSREIWIVGAKRTPFGAFCGTVKDLTDQGWVLQKSWDKDPEFRKEFRMKQPGKFNQMLVVWDAFAEYENDRWNHLEVFGAETPVKGNGIGKK